MTRQPNLIYEKDGRIARLTLNRPESLNAISPDLSEELKAALADFDHDPDAWLAIVSGNGRCFCAGADLRAASETPRLATSRLEHYYLDAPVNWKPVIAAVHGYCYGAGLAFVSECDLIVATEDATFSIVETKRGILPITLSAQLAPWMGSKKVTEMIVTGDPITAQDAYRLGLINQLVSSREELMPAAEALAQRVLANPPLVVRTAIKAARMSVFQSQIYRDSEIIYKSTPWSEWDDFKEGLEAFREKRPPVFKGK